MNPSSQAHVYWERQGTDRLCGVHCVNAILQGPFYDEVQLAQLALEIDRKEKELFYANGGKESDYLVFTGGGSNNVSEDGNYSIQVLSEALKVYNILCENIDSQTNRSGDLSQEEGFICNNQYHWISIRRINGKWYNLNSTNRKGPEMISDFYLSAFLNSVKENGYTIFVVKGTFPPNNPSNFGPLKKNQKFFTQAECEKLNQDNLKSKNFKLNIGSTDDRDLEDAIQASLNDYNRDEEGKMDEEGEGKEDAAPEKKFQAFTGQGVSLSGNPAPAGNASQGGNAGGGGALNPDQELALAIRMSIRSRFEHIPPEGEDTIVVNVRFPSGKALKWHFFKNDIVQDVYDFVNANLEDNEFFDFDIKTSYPIKTLADRDATLEAAGIESYSSLTVAKK